jgi:hypothetical protein
MDPTPDATEHRDRARTSQEKLTTADVANPNRPVEQPTQLREGPAPQLHPKPSPSEVNSAVNQQTERDDAPLLGDEEASGFRTRWDGIQAQFVDDPRHAVEEADHLVAEAIKTLAQGFADERTELERQWDRGDDISTEDLRVSLQHYRSFFHRLLAA